MRFGLELEWADVDRARPVPADLGSWSEHDYSIVNSDGHANCPTGTRWRWGGEINTIPTDTVEEQCEIVKRLESIYSPVVNYKCNLHVHVSVDGLIGDVGMLKAVATYLRTTERVAYTLVDPLPRPTAVDFPDKEELAGAVKRWRRNLTSHHHSLSRVRWSELMSASTPEEFRLAHAPKTSTGGRAWHVAPRPGMNMRSLWKHGTIEFRHFFGSTSPEEIESALTWCRDVVASAVSTDPRLPEEIYESRRWRFPRAVRYDHRLQIGFENTKHK